MRNWLSLYHRRRTVILFLLFTGILTAGYAFNAWHAADQAWFLTHQWDSEASILGRIIVSRHQGIAAYHFFIGPTYDYSTSPGWPRQQYMSYTLDYTHNNAYYPYVSQIGVQGTVYFLLDQAMNIFSADTRLAVMHFLTALMLAGMMAVLLLWVGREFGRLAAILVLIAACWSPWTTGLAKNLYWVLWVYYLPLLTVLVLLWREEQGRRLSAPVLGLAVTTAMVVKCACGYEFITTTLVSLCVPVVYYAVKQRWPVMRFIKRLGLVGGSGLLGLLLTVALHIAQLTALYQDDMPRACAYIGQRFAYRTLKAPTISPTEATINYAAMRGRVADVLALYLGKTGFSAFTPLLSCALSYALLLIVFGGAALLLPVMFKKYPYDPGERRKAWALLGALVAGALGSISWLVLFIGHSFQHNHINSVLWDMPTVPLGFALLGYTFTLYLAGRESQKLP